MDDIDTCKQLRSLVEQGPGENPDALSKARQDLGRFSDRDVYVREKASTLRFDFEEWFSPRKWDRRRDGGAWARMQLLGSLCKLEKAIASAPARARILET